jgi:beta-galactosidase/beta-glucuronidase
MEVSAKAKLAKATLASIIAISLSGCGGDSPEPPTNNAIVSLEQSDGNWTLYRYGEPYYVKGIGGQHALEFASAAGANSTRTWSSENAGNVLDQANELGMTVLLGIWLSHQASDYSNEAYKNSIRSELQQLLNNYSDHPALLMWGLGNEINLGADTQEAWEFVEELAQMVNAQDINHPTMTVNAGASPNTLSNIAQWAPSIDVLGINSYGGVTNTDESVTASSFDGPYMITE